MNESPPERIESLTGLRFWAALHVVLFHATMTRDGILGRILGVGPFSVSLFFVLSGFILSYVYLRREPLDARSFWAARFARVYPIYLVGLVLTLLAFALPHPWGYFDPRPFNTKALVASLFLVQSWKESTACVINCPGWSLSDEAFFYFVFPIAAVALAHRSQRTLIATAIGVATVTMAVGALLIPDLGRQFAPLGHVPARWLVSAWNPIIRLPEFLLGAVVGAIALRLAPGIRARSRAWGAIALVAMASILTLYTAGPGSPWRVMHGVLLPILFAMLILGTAFAGRPAAVVLGNSVAITLGETSYSLYILHYPIMQIYARAADFAVVPPTTDRRGIAMELALIFMVAYTAYAFIERPARGALRHRFGLRTP